MIIEYLPERGLHLRDAFDLDKLKLVFKAEATVGSPSLRGIVIVDRDNALVPIDLIPVLPGRPDDKSWETAYRKMIASAAALNWIDADANAIRVHIERTF
ncbi:hypothetical protein GPL17_22475 [Bradyrhizobium yuanmingense]|uniref:hypothetical protein n=1 Tax=Bradyrhizobium TaxID=374 RepID=UPI0012FA5730|nr:MULTISPECIES: hypothetical protein [Bradyrhizobium]MDF0493001.1 hypothetical protein [Bradyrhizobium yuanmingense]MDF0516731.1 hypothetical protein [Bradyrhizobium yuanmingense]MVT53241.1 hypothetical protein [Bradyrhizobium yuanmingense]UWU67712.1 hypothetical protein N2602_31430 [Bradyrhizobium sp. NC92]